MKNGLSRFAFYTQQIEVLLNKAGEQENPAKWLFDNNSRTPVLILRNNQKTLKTG